MFSPVAFVAKELPGAGVGFVVGAFVPSVLRKVKAFFVSEEKKVKTQAEAVAKKV
jgi:hypothetical protein